MRILLFVHLDANKMRIQNMRNLFACKRFSSHDMTPMTSAVANREEDIFLFFFCFGKSVIAPREPMNGIVFVLDKIGWGLGVEEIDERALEFWNVSILQIRPNRLFI